MKTLICAAVAMAVLGSVRANALEVPEAEWEQFKAQLAAMSQRVSALEVENQQLRAVSTNKVIVEDLAATKAEVGALREQANQMSWAEKIKWKGDYRFRYEDIDQENKDSRDRWRIRARPALVAQTSNNTQVGFGLATGGDDPVSSNQTLGNGSSSKNINLDLAYATWTPLENTYVTGGIFKNPYYSVEGSQLIFDGDFRLEGVSMGWTDEMFFANAAYNFIESDSSKNEYSVWLAQVGANFTPFDGVSLTASAAYLDIPTKGEAAIYNDDFFGNTFFMKDGVEVYEYDYNLANASLNLGLNAFDMPLSFFVDYVQNTDADDFDTGYLAGVQLGNASKKGDWEVLYQYEDLDANATLGLITDSDFAGGGTDAKGSTFKAKYAIDDSWYVATTYYFDNTRGAELGEDVSYDRIQIDTGFKY